MLAGTIHRPRKWKVKTFNQQFLCSNVSFFNSRFLFPYSIVLIRVLYIFNFSKLLIFILKSFSNSEYFSFKIIKLKRLVI